MRAYPQDSLGDALRNVFDFDVYRPETMAKLAEILERHGCVLCLIYCLLNPRT